MKAVAVALLVAGGAQAFVPAAPAASGSSTQVRECTHARTLINSHCAANSGGAALPQALHLHSDSSAHEVLHRRWCHDQRQPRKLHACAAALREFDTAWYLRHLPLLQCMQSDAVRRGRMCLSLRSPIIIVCRRLDVQRADGHLSVAFTRAAAVTAKAMQPVVVVACTADNHLRRPAMTVCVMS